LASRLSAAHVLLDVAAVINFDRAADTVFLGILASISAK
jgi:hypothetical protein